jgi:phosphoglycerate dehydrogenase-like enzyme
MVTGKRVVIVGYGAIGREVARMLRGFEVEVTGVRARMPEATPDDLGTSVITKETMAKALRGADFVFVAAPDTPATRGLVGKPELDAMKDTAVLVNVSRGPVVEERALFEALKGGRLGAAGLDVWYVYPHSKEEIPRTFPGHHPFHELDNVVLSPHRASFTPRLYREHWVDVVENIRRVAAGKQVTNPIDLESGY